MPPILTPAEPIKSLLSVPLYKASPTMALTTNGASRPIPCHELPVVDRATPPDVPCAPGKDPATNICDPTDVIDRTTAPFPCWALKLLNAENVPVVVLYTPRWLATYESEVNVPPT